MVLGNPPYLIQMSLKTFQSYYGRAKNPGASWVEYGSPSLNFCGAPGTNFFCGAFLRGILRGCAPQALAPQKAPQDEPSGLNSSFGMPEGSLPSFFLSFLGFEDPT